jgi:hypothetical protein
MKDNIEHVGKRLLNKQQSQIVAGELRSIERASGLITPKLVVDRARSGDSPMHRYFEWNNGKAAEAYREVQAGRLIRMVYVKSAYDEKLSPVRAFVNVRPMPDGEEEDSAPSLQGYVSMQTVMSNTGMREQVLQYARSQLLMWKKKFGAYKEFFAVVDAINGLK